MSEHGVYVASRTRHGARWRALRADGYPVACSWIDESDPGQTEDYAELWLRIYAEVRLATVLILYVEGVDDFPLKGALIECGAALAYGKPVLVVLKDVVVEGPTRRPVGSWIEHPGVQVFSELKPALETARILCQ